MKSTTALLVAASAVFVPACESKSHCVTTGTVAAVEGSHTHEVDIPKEHVARAVGGTYPLSGQADHSHVIHLTDADMAELKAGRGVKTRASSVNAHTHEVAISCKD